MVKITSVKNEYIKNILKLKLAKEVKLQSLYLVEGEHLVKESMKYGLLEEVLITSNNKLEVDVNTTMISDEVMERLSNLKSIPTIIGVVRVEQANKIIGDKILLLDNISDPGNLGTIIRSAKAFNIDSIVMSLDCVSLYNEKVLRSTQGMHFNMNIVKMDLIEAISEIKEKDIRVLGAVVSNSTSIRDVNLDRWALVVGNEGMGISNDVINLLDVNVTIPMNKECESLNVSIATGICLYELNNG